MSPFSALRLRAHDDEVTVEDADVDHRLAPHAEHEQLAVTGEVLGEREHFLDVLGREHAGARRDVTEERDVAHRPAFDGRAGDRLERHLDRARLGRVAAQVALVLQRREVRVHGGGGRQPDGLADLAHATAG